MENRFFDILCKAECSLVKKVKILKLYKGGACSKFPSLEKGG